MGSPALSSPARDFSSVLTPPALSHRLLKRAVYLAIDAASSDHSGSCVAASIRSGRHTLEATRLSARSRPPRAADQELGLGEQVILVEVGEAPNLHQGFDRQTGKVEAALFASLVAPPALRDRSSNRAVYLAIAASSRVGAMSASKKVTPQFFECGGRACSQRTRAGCVCGPRFLCVMTSPKRR